MLSLSQKRMLNESLFAALLQFGGLSLSALSLPLYPVNFAMGTSLAFVLFRGYRLLGGVAVGSLLACYAYTRCWEPSLLYTVAMTLPLLIMRYVSVRFLGPSLVFYRLSPFLGFVLCWGLCLFLGLFPLVFIPDLGRSWISIYVANFISAFALALPLIALDAYFPESPVLKASLTPINRLLSIVVFLFAVYLAYPKAALNFWVSSILFGVLFIKSVIQYGRPAWHWAACLFGVGICVPMMLGVGLAFDVLLRLQLSYFVIVFVAYGLIILKSRKRILMTSDLK